MRFVADIPGVSSRARAAAITAHSGGVVSSPRIGTRSDLPVPSGLAAAAAAARCALVALLAVLGATPAHRAGRPLPPAFLGARCAALRATACRLAVATLVAIIVFSVRRSVANTPLVFYCAFWVGLRRRCCRARVSSPNPLRLSRNGSRRSGSTPSVACSGWRPVSGTPPAASLAVFRRFELSSPPAPTVAFPSSCSATRAHRSPACVRAGLFDRGDARGVSALSRPAPARRRADRGWWCATRSTAGPVPSARAWSGDRAFGRSTAYDGLSRPRVEGAVPPGVATAPRARVVVSS